MLVPVSPNSLKINIPGDIHLNAASGSVIIPAGVSASGGFTGSLEGTASFATTASFSTTASFALSAKNSNTHLGLPTFTYATESSDPSVKVGLNQFLDIDNGITRVFGYNSKSLNDVNLGDNNKFLYEDAGSKFTIIHTSSGAFKTYTADSIHLKDSSTGSMQFTYTPLLVAGSGSIESGDTVFMRADQSSKFQKFTSPTSTDQLYLNLGLISGQEGFNILDVRYSDDEVQNTGLLTTTSIALEETRIFPAIATSSKLILHSVTGSLLGDVNANSIISSTVSASGKIETDTINADSSITGSAALISTQQENSTSYPQTVNGLLKLDQSNSTSNPTQNSSTARGLTIGNRSTGLNAYSGITFVVSKSIGRIAYQKVDHNGGGDFVFLPQNNTSARPELLRISGLEQNISASVPVTASGLLLDYDLMPSSNPGIKGAVYRNASNQLFISTGSA